MFTRKWMMAFSYSICPCACIHSFNVSEGDWELVCPSCLLSWLSFITVNRKLCNSLFKAWRWLVRPGGLSLQSDSRRSRDSNRFSQRFDVLIEEIWGKEIDMMKSHFDETWYNIARKSFNPNNKIGRNVYHVTKIIPMSVSWSATIMVKGSGSQIRGV